MGIDNYYLQLLRQKPINYNGLIFHQITFDEICDSIGFDIYERILLPFCYTKECFDIQDSSAEDLFEDLIMKDQQIVNSIGIALMIFCKPTDIRKTEKEIFLFFDRDNTDNNFVINKHNFKDIAEIIRIMNCKSLLEVDEPPKGLSAKKLDIWKKLHEGRKKEIKKKEIYIYDILNVCEYGGNFHISQEELGKMTLWSINNCYHARVGMKTYDDDLKICLVSGDGKSVSDKNHWHYKLMVHGK